MKKKKMPFIFYKMVNILLIIIPFLCCWGMYYERRTTTIGSKQVTGLVIMAYIALFYYFGQRLECFRVSIFRIREIALAQILATMITNAIIYILIWMLSVHLPNIIPGFITWVTQCVIGIIWSVVMHRAYFQTHSPLKTIVIYDERVGMEKLIHSYGLQKRFEIVDVIKTEYAMDNFKKFIGIEAVFLCGIHSSQRNKIMKYCVSHDIKIFMIPRISDVVMRGSEQVHMMHLPIIKNQRYKPSFEYEIIKRMMDIVVSGITLIILSPLFLVIAIAIKSDGGPVFYRQERYTKNGKIFKIIKFRSMCVDAEKYSGAVLSTGTNDARITKVGRILRAWRLDELPQLINILKGEMSLVGPRPERPELHAEIEKVVPEFGLRLQTKAGLTGYAQVYGKYNTTSYDKLLMDLMYIAKPSILEDLTIILATAKILANKKSTEGVGEAKIELEFREVHSTDI